MKKTLLLIVAALCCTFATAQSLKLSRKAPAAPTQQLTALRKGAPAHLKAVTLSPITTQPEGELLPNMLWTAISGYPNNGKVEWMEVTDLPCSIVINGDKMYIQDPLSNFNVGNWIEGTINGETVTFKTPQAFYRQGLNTFYLTRFTETGQIDENNLDVTFTYKDGSLIQTDGGILALSDIKGNFYGYAEYDITAHQINDEMVTLPAEAQTELYKMTFNGTEQQTAQVAFVGEDVYISDPVGVENVWMKGTLKDGIISVPTKQFLGTGSGYALYVQSATTYTYTETNQMGQIVEKIGYKLTDDATIDFTFDADKKTFSTQQLMLINAGKDKVSDARMPIDKPSYEPWTLVPATPANPSISYFINLDAPEYVMAGYKGCLLAFDIPAKDVDGEFIAQECIYYQISFDETPVDFGEGATFVPYYATLEDAEQGIYLGLQGDLFSLQHPDCPQKSVGLQTFYVLGEDVYMSELVTRNIIDGQLEDAISDVIADRFTQHTMYNLQGQRVNQNARGIVIAGGKKFIRK